MTDYSKKFQRQGDKKNSDFFEQYLPKIYERRENSGLNDLLGNMHAVLVQVQDALSYMQELYLMTPYRFHAGFMTNTHKVYVLRIKPEYPDYLILEPSSDQYHDYVDDLNNLFPRSREKTKTRYLGEIYQTKDLAKTVEILKLQYIRFQEEPANAFLADKNFRFTEPSYFTNNIVGYTQSNLENYADFGTPLHLSAEETEGLEKMDKLHRHFGMHELIYGLDHLATRVFCNSREDALLEFLTMSNYYFWGAYNIDEMNSSTNICRNPNISYELHSPAKVFTANNTPFYVESIDGLPSPTEDFVRNFGRRMHHLAYEVADGETDGIKNIDYVVNKLIESDIPFLAEVIGECRDIPDLKQIFSKASRHSVLITEYVQRCKGFGGFFTKTNVAKLTEAAGKDEGLSTMVGD